MMTAAQVQAVKRNLLAAQISYKRSELNEQSLYVELHNFFQQLKETVLHELREYWKDDETILLQGQRDLILAPIFESQQEYYNILRKHNIKEYNFGCKEASRLVKLSRKSVSSLKAESNTIKVNNLLNSAIDKDELFGTNDWTQQRLLDQSFTASENTMNRVDQDINKIISDGYKSGAGVNKVAANIETRFEQLKTWESRRIARTEMHNAHQMGIMNTYHEMGVQYTQWSSAHDSRVRGLKPKDKANHVKMDGEIIPLGGTYSNGLQYPGDTKGPLYEWINCRCGNVPFIMPDGYMAPPGKAQFREEDLIQTLDYWNQDDLIKQATQEASQIPEGKILEEIKRTNGFDIYRLPSGQREHYLKLKKNHDILKEALETKNYNKLDQLDHSAATMIESKATVKELGDDFLELAKEELEDYSLDILEYEKIIKDKNIKVTIEPKGIKWKNETLKDYLIHNSKTGKYEPFNANEKFIKYHFKKENLTILESVDMDTSRVMHVYNEYKKLPKRLQNTNEIVLSSQQPIKTVLGFDDAKLGGYVIKGKGSRIVEFKKTLNETIDTIVHEATHNLEKDQLYYISNSKEYVLAFKKDQKRLLSQGKTLKETYVTDYAYSFTEAALESNTAANRAYGHRIYSEDLAESMKDYLRNKERFSKKYPEKAKVLKKILNGGFKPKTTTPYKKWYDIESERFKLTQKEFDRQSELNIKRNKGDKLSPKELKELEFYNDKTTFDYLYNKKIKGELLDNAEEKAFETLTKKWRRKLEIPNEIILELSDSSYTNKASKFTFTLEDKLKYDELQKLKQENKLLFSNRNKLELLETQKELDSLHQKFIKKGKLSSKEAKRYKELYNNKKIQRKFKLDLLEDTAKLKGKSVSPGINDEQYTGDMDNPKNIKQFKGTRKDGMLPRNESIDTYFTKNVTTTEKHDEIIEKWAYHKAYKDVQLFEKCDRNVDTLRKVIKESNKRKSAKKIEAMVNEVVDNYNEFEKLMNGAKLKKNIRLHRRQRKPYISDDDLKRGKTTIRGSRSFSVSKEGTQKYVGKAKSYIWEVELEAPVGTDAVYIAPKAKSKKYKNKFIEQMETIVKDGTECDIIEVIDTKKKHKVILRAIV